LLRKVKAWAGGIRQQTFRRLRDYIFEGFSGLRIVSRQRQIGSFSLEKVVDEEFEVLEQPGTRGSPESRGNRAHNRGD
jgi:hypothetical protein